MSKDYIQKNLKFLQGIEKRIGKPPFLWQETSWNFTHPITEERQTGTLSLPIGTFYNKDGVISQEEENPYHMWTVFSERFLSNEPIESVGGSLTEFSHDYEDWVENSPHHILRTVGSSAYDVIEKHTAGFYELRRQVIHHQNHPLVRNNPKADHESKVMIVGAFMPV